MFSSPLLLTVRVYRLYVYAFFLISIKSTGQYSQFTFTLCEYESNIYCWFFCGDFEKKCWEILDIWRRFEFGSVWVVFWRSIFSFGLKWERKKFTTFTISSMTNKMRLILSNTLFPNHFKSICRNKRDTFYLISFSCQSKYALNLIMYFVDTDWNNWASCSYN